MLPCLDRDWDGETVFVVAGGPSVTQVDVDRLRGHRVVVINSSYERAPWADALLFTDLRWWRRHRDRVRSTFGGGQIITLTPHHRLYDARLLVLERQRSSGLSSDPTRLAWWHTSLTTAINMCVLRGAARTCILGLDGDGDWHHEPHPAVWGRNRNKFKYHAEALEALVDPLRAVGHEVINVNPSSKHKMFSFAPLGSILEDLEFDLEAAALNEAVVRELAAGGS